MKASTIFLCFILELGYMTSALADSYEIDLKAIENNHVIQLNYYDNIILQYVVDVRPSTDLELDLNVKKTHSNLNSSSVSQLSGTNYSTSIIKDESLSVENIRKGRRSQEDFSNELADRFPEWGMGGVVSPNGDFSDGLNKLSTTPSYGISSSAPIVEGSLPSTSVTTEVKKRPTVAYGYTSYVQEAVQNKMRYVPFYYTYRLPQDQRYQLSIKLPMYRAENETTKTNMAGVNIAVKLPLLPQWAVSLSTNLTYSNAQEYRQTSKMRSFVFTSNYMIKHEKFDLFIGNTIGYYDVYNISYDNENYDPKLKNTVFRNGILMSIPNVNVLGNTLTTEISFINTRIQGSELSNVLTRFQNEVGVTLGQRRSDPNSNVEYTRMGLSYMKGDNTRGVRFNWGYWF